MKRDKNCPFNLQKTGHEAGMPAQCNGIIYLSSIYQSINQSIYHCKHNLLSSSGDSRNFPVCPWVLAQVMETAQKYQKNSNTSIILLVLLEEHGGLQDALSSTSRVHQKHRRM